MTDKSVNAASAVMRRQSLHANVLRACKACGAPGYWHNVDPTINPGCYAPDKVTQLGMDPVGTVCPNCGADREAVEPHGEVWFKEWRVSPWTAIKGAIGNLFKQWRLQ